MLGVTGFVALVYEVSFTRVLALAVGPTTYAFAAMLTAFITGLAIGAALASRLSRKETSGVTYAIGLLLLVAPAVGSGAGWFAGTRLPLLVARTVDLSVGGVQIRSAWCPPSEGVVGIQVIASGLGACIDAAVVAVSPPKLGICTDYRTRLRFVDDDTARRAIPRWIAAAAHPSRADS